MNQRAKKITSVALMAIGVFLIILSIHFMNRISQAKNDINHLSKPLSKNRMGKMFGDAMSSKASQYDKTVRWMLIGGVASAVLGVGFAFSSRKK